MKKLISIFASILFTVVSLFAADSYTVKSVKGKVTYEASAGKFKDITVGQVLSISTVINTGVNATLVLSADDETFTIKPMQKGTVESLVSTNVAGGFKKNPSTTTNKKAIAAATNSTGKGVDTASERSKGKGEENIEIDE